MEIMVAIIFNEIQKLNLNQFKETEFIKIVPTQINVSGRQYVFEGIHTYNQTEKYEIIDLKVKRRTTLVAKLNIIFWLFRRFILRRIRRMI